MRAPTVLVVVLGFGFGFGACGSENDADRIRSLIEEQGTSKDPDLCSAGSDSLVAQTSLGSSYAAKDNERFCRANIARIAPDSIDVSRVEVDGDEAEAEFSPHGGQLVFDKATIELRKTDGDWATQRLKALTLDRRHFETTSARQLTSGQDALTASSGRCFVRRMKRLSDREIERGIVGARAGFLLDATARCVMAPELRKQGLPARQISCIVRGLLRRDRDRVMQIVTGTGPTAEARANRLFDNILRFCPRN